MQSQSIQLYCGCLCPRDLEKVVEICFARKAKQNKPTNNNNKTTTNKTYDMVSLKDEGRDAERPFEGGGKQVIFLSWP